MTPRKIAVLRFSALGDVAMTVPVLKTFADTYPDKKIYFVSRPFFEPVFKQIPWLTYIPADVDNHYKGLHGLWALSREIKRINPDVVLDLHDVLRTKIIRRFLRLQGIPVKVIDKGRREKKALVNKPLREAVPLKTTHQRYADVFASAGLPVNLEKFKPVKPPLSEEVRLFLEMFGNSKKIGIAPLAKHPGKQYPTGGTKEVIEILIKKTSDTVIFLFGAPGEKKLLETMVTDKNRVFNLAGLFSFDKELEIISRLDLMWAMDSGNGHLAANFGVPVITTWGITHPYAGFAPFGQKPEQQILPDTNKFPMLPCSIYGNKICPGYEKIWDDVLPETVAETIIEHLA